MKFITCSFTFIPMFIRTLYILATCFNHPDWRTSANVDRETVANARKHSRRAPSRGALAVHGRVVVLVSLSRRFCFFGSFAAAAAAVPAAHTVDHSLQDNESDRSNRKRETCDFGWREKMHSIPLELIN